MYVENMCLSYVVYHFSKEPEAPSDFKATNFGSTEVTLDWTKPKVTTKEGLSYTVSSLNCFVYLGGIVNEISETILHQKTALGKYAQ